MRSFNLICQLSSTQDYDKINSLSLYFFCSKSSNIEHFISCFFFLSKAYLQKKQTTAS